MPKTRPFTMVDFYESLSVIDAVKVDFDNSYPHHTEKLNNWIQYWLPRLLENESTDSRLFYQAVPVESGLCIAGLSQSELAYNVAIQVDRHEVLTAMAIVINLSQCSTFQSVSNVLGHFLPGGWSITPTLLVPETFIEARRQFYHTLQEVVMTHLSTETVAPSAFTRWDFDDAVVLLKRVQHKEEGADKDLVQWFLTWKPAIQACEEDTAFFIALPVDDGIVFSPPETGASSIQMHWVQDVPLVLVALSTLVNLSQCTTFDEVSAIIHYFRGRGWPQDKADMSRLTAINVRKVFHQTLLKQAEEEASHG